MGGSDTDAETVDDTASNKSAPILAADLYSRADEPEQVGKPDRVSSTPFIGTGPCDYGAHDGAGGER